MSVAAAIRIAAEDQEHVIRRATDFARQRGVPCFVISVVDELPYGRETDPASRSVRRNLELIAASAASPVMQEGRDVPAALLTVAQSFGVRTMFLPHAGPPLLGRSTAENLLYLDPPFDVVVVGSDGT